MSDPWMPKPNRTPWIVAGVLGCLVLCLIGVVAAGGAYFVLGPGAATPVGRVQPTAPPVATQRPTVPLGQPSQPPVQATQAGGQPTQPSVQPTQPQVQPTKPSASSAPTGRIAFTVRRGANPEDNYVWLMNADGSGAKKILDRASEPSFSPDGTKIVYYHWTDGIYVANLDGSSPKKIVGDTFVGSIAWSHDGRWIAFFTQPAGKGNVSLDVVAPDGTARRNVAVGKGASWSPDDAWIAIDSCDTASHCGIFKVSSGGGPISPLVTDAGGLPAWSPDGTKILYQTEVDGQKQLFLIDAEGSGKKQLTQGPVLHVSGNWSPDGNFIFYRSPEGGTWGIWRMNADGSNPVRLAGDMPPGDWPFDRIAVIK